MKLLLTWYGIVIVAGMLAWPMLERLVEPIRLALQMPLVKF